MRVALSLSFTFVPIGSFAIPIVAALSFAGGAHAQTNGTFLLTSTNAVSPSSPSTTIEIWAMWDDPGADFVIGPTNYDLTAGDGAFSNPVNVFNGPGSTAGVITGNVIRGGINGHPTFQLFPFWNDDNPILLATYDWTTTDFTPRAVSLDTSNTNSYVLIEIPLWASIQLFPDEFMPGAGGINVVPAPGAALLIALPFACLRRRRQC